MPTPPAAAPMSETDHAIDEEETTLAEEAAARFADLEDDASITLLMSHLKKHAKTSASHRPWHMLLDIYQAQDDKSSFEKLASMFAGRFNTSPPSWRRPPHRAPQTMGRNVLIISGAPTKVSPDKRRDFLAAARTHGFCRLDISRIELPSDPLTFEPEIEALRGLLDRMTRLRIKVMLMGDGQLMELLRKGVDEKKWPESAWKSAWHVLLMLLQWRGEHDEFEQRAMAFVDQFDQSAPGYELDAVLALDAPAKEPEAEDDILDEAKMQARCDDLSLQYQTGGSAHLTMDHVFRVSYSAALLLSAFLVRIGFDSRRMEIRHPSEMIVALFDSTGVSPQVTYVGRGR